jgi:hypothetical protein
MSDAERLAQSGTRMVVDSDSGEFPVGALDWDVPVARESIHRKSAGLRQPGDIIITGTPSRVGMARKPQVWMKAGDICEVALEGIGVLRNPVVDEQLDARQPATW